MTSLSGHASKPVLSMVTGVLLKNMTILRGHPKTQ
nr:MAG TPA: hypothetical protein [Caudoviricetes sp.]